MRCRMSWRVDSQLGGEVVVKKHPGFEFAGVEVEDEQCWRYKGV